MIKCNHCPIIEHCPTNKYQVEVRYAADGYVYETVLSPNTDTECLLLAKVNTVVNILSHQSEASHLEIEKNAWRTKKH